MNFFNIEGGCRINLDLVTEINTEMYTVKADGVTRTWLVKIKYLNNNEQNEFILSQEEWWELLEFIDPPEE